MESSSFYQSVILSLCHQCNAASLTDSVRGSRQESYHSHISCPIHLALQSYSLVIPTIIPGQGIRNNNAGNNVPCLSSLKPNLFYVRILSPRSITFCKMIHPRGQLNDGTHIPASVLLKRYSSSYAMHMHMQSAAGCYYCTESASIKTPPPPLYTITTPLDFLHTDHNTGIVGKWIV